jgi:dUTP pyrophosphatase
VKTTKQQRINMINKIKKVFEYILTFSIANVFSCDEKQRDFMVVSKYFKNKKHIKLPHRSTENSAGYDFYNNTGSDIIIKARSFSETIPTYIKAYMKEDEVLQMYPRSSHGFKYGLQLANTVGIIDSDFFNNPNNEGEISVKFYNNGDSDVVIKNGDKFVQGIFTKYLKTDTDKDFVGGKRNGGIGSTNKKGK